MSIILKPVITEKMTGQADKFNRFGFFVDSKANKIEIRNTIEKMYKVTVTDVRTIITPGKIRKRMKRTGIQTGRVGKYKKAIITLKQGDTIDFYSNI